MNEIRSRQLSESNKLMQNYGRRHSRDYSYTTRKARRGRSVLLSWFHDVTSSAARKGIVERGDVSLVVASLAVDVVVAEWLVVDNLSRKDASKAAFVVLLSLFNDESS